MVSEIITTNYFWLSKSWNKWISSCTCISFFLKDIGVYVLHQCCSSTTKLVLVKILSIWKSGRRPTRCFATSFALVILLSARFLPANVLRNYWRDQHKTFQDDSLAFVDVRNKGHFVRKCMNARARAFEFLHIKTCKSNFFILRSNSIKFTW
jgi:hypothetical protein